ncbi:DUF5050 domain-containing protein [Paenibacillus rhizovicinus]|uniref:DUF5050 domain-containing protein n=1 Tax=Paenibacillus rhizovicinus TaxID=2704463 RepID=A0A6C0P0B2_9BACL|nr:DUF5050 domain-containing protein [Paenibacillus rhizovicinus]QHW31353.1 DUF5050 domain-containing protein [Paenibacillus rhizovicinus]
MTAFNNKSRDNHPKSAVSVILKSVIALSIVFSSCISTVHASQLQYSSSTMNELSDTLSSMPQQTLYGVSNEGWIYYFNNPGGYMNDTRDIRKIKYDGSEDSDGNNDELINFSTPGSKVGYEFYHVQSKDTLLKKIRDENADILRIIDGWVFYITWDKKQILRGKLDGSEKNIIVSASSNIHFESLTVYKDYLYFTKPNDDGGSSLYRSRLDGKGLTLLSNEYLFPIQLKRNNLLVDQLYYYDYNKGSEDAISIVNDVIYFVSEHGITRMNTDGKNQKLLTKEKYGRMYLDGDSIYYSTWWQLPNEKGTYAANGPIYRVKLTGGTPQKLTQGYSSIIAVDQGWIYAEEGSFTEPGTLIRFKPANPSKREVVIPYKKETYYLLNQVIGDWFVYSEYKNDIEVQRKVKFDGSMSTVLK